MTSLKVSRSTNNNGNSTFLYPPAQSNEQIQTEIVVDSQQLRKSVSEELNTFFEGKIWLLVQACLAHRLMIGARSKKHATARFNLFGSNIHGTLV